MKKITIDPITRLEGHGKIEIFLNDKGDCERACLQIPELRGFEKFSVGRAAEEMPRITTMICGVCPTAHHIAATKTLDDLFKVEPTSAGMQRSSTVSSAETFQFSTGEEVCMWRAGRRSSTARLRATGVGESACRVQAPVSSWPTVLFGATEHLRAGQPRHRFCVLTAEGTM